MTDPQLEGVTLAERLAHGPIEPQEALSILVQLLDRVAVIHDSGMVHGSISPENIVLSPDGRANLVGIPAAAADQPPGTRAPKAPPNPEYMAPEQILDDPVDARADLYSLGVVGYAMLTGKDPFGATEGANANNSFYRILYKPSPIVPAAVLAGLPAGAGPALDLAMSKEPQSRFQDAASFREALLSGDAVVAVAVPLAAAAAVGGRRKWMPYALAGGVIVVLLALGLGVAYAVGGGGGSTGSTLAAIDTLSTTTSTEPITTTEPVTSTETTAAPTTDTVAPDTTLDTSSTTTVDTSSTTTATTAAPSTTATTAPRTTTTRRTTTTARPTTTTALKTATITVTSAAKTYSGSAQHPTVSTSPAGLAVKYSSQPTNAGSYTITVTVTSAGYKGSKSTSFTIAKADPIISVSGWTGAYDGNPHGAVLNYAHGVKGENLSGVSLGDTFIDVGSHIATWTYPGNANYNSDSRSVAITIN
jgi:hypothetical protein